MRRGLVAGSLLVPIVSLFAASLSFQSERQATATVQNDPYARIYLPFAYQILARPGSWISPTPVTHTPTPWPSRTVTPGPSSTATGTVTTSTPTGHTPSPSPTSTMTVTASAAATDTPTASTTASPGPSPTDGPTPSQTPSPTPYFAPRDPAAASVAPAAAAREGGSVMYDEATRTYRFELAGPAPVILELETFHPDVTRGRLALRDRTSGRYPLAGAGMFYRSESGAVFEPRLFRSEWPVDSVEHAIIGESLVMTVTETIEEATLAKRYTLSPVGGSLAIHAESLDDGGPAEGRYAGFSAGNIEGWSEAVAVRVPYMGMAPVTMVGRSLFVGLLIDYPRSHAFEFAPRGPEAQAEAFTHEIAAIYEANADGMVPPIDEVVWLTVSPDIVDLFAVPSQGPAPHRPGLVRHAHAHVDPQGGATLDDVTRWLERLRGFGVDRLVVHVPSLSEPALLPPANLPVAAALGGDEAARRLAESGTHIVAAGLSYTDTVRGCPGLPNPLWREGDAPIGVDGEPKALPVSFTCPDGSSSPRLLLAPGAADRVARAEATRLRDLSIGAATLRTLADWNPAWGWPNATANVLDRAAEPTNPATAGGAIRAVMALIDGLQRDLGPVMASGASGLWEARYDSLYAGYLDGGLRAPSTGVADDSARGQDTLVVPDYELRVVRPRMIGYGMGDYHSYFGASVTAPLSEARMDAWRAAELSFGHSHAFWTLALTATTAAPWQSEADVLKDYYGVSAVAGMLQEQPVAAVEYLGPDGTPRDLSTALRDELNLLGPRLRVRYGDGPTFVWVNHGVTSWPIEVRNRILDVPTNGWVVDAPQMFAFSAIVDGRRVDLVQAPGYVLLDGRGVATDFGVGTATDLRILFQDGRILEEQQDGTVAWR